jgi:hypothetical protein
MKTRYEWRLWLYGLGSAFIGGGSTALSTGATVSVIDPEKFNLSNPRPLFIAMVITFVASGLTPFFAYLKQHPLPAIITVTTKETTSLQQNPPALVKETVQTTEEKQS